MPSEGDLINERYRLDARIAAGGMGEVWRATDTLLGRSVAVKLLHDDRSGEREFQTRFHHEARSMAALRHPGIAAVYDYGGDGSGAFIVMAFIDGVALDRRIAEEGRLDAPTTMSVVAQAARALEAAHEAGIVHRDVKPGNLIVQPDGTVVLVDFGVARYAALASVTATNDVVGTALYIAPEQVSKRPTGPATDVYALGAVAYHCVAGHPPFMGDNPVAIAVHHLNDEPPPLPADVPAPVRDVITTAMDKQPSRRYPSAAAFAIAAEAAAASAAGSATAAALASTEAATVAAPGTAAPGTAAPGTAARGVATPGAAAPIGIASRAAGGRPTAATAQLDARTAAGFGDEPPRRAPRRTVLLWVLGLLALAALAVAITLASGTIFRGPDTTPTPTADVTGDTGVGTAPAGGGNNTGRPATPGSSGQPGGSGQATTGNGGGATPPGGGGATQTTGPQPTDTPPAQETTAPAPTTEPLATGSG
ncbi:protein kinase domain-containing protein [Dactylosporangium darangshiense]|uniref:protein kinase domain-containing protein n=1 Tax=Dactylosporangium darangshiense TaxID=579108 RepID=UPI0031E57E8B